VTVDGALVIIIIIIIIITYDTHMVKEIEFEE